MYQNTFYKIIIVRPLYYLNKSVCILRATWYITVKNDPANLVLPFRRVLFSLLITMARGVPTSRDLRIRIINAHKNGISARKISTMYYIPRTTVQDIIKLHKVNKNIILKPKTGRPSSISKRDKNSLKKIILQNRRYTAGDITSLWNKITKKNLSITTTRRTIKSMGFKFYKAKEKPFLTKKHKKNRLKWAKDHQNWTLDQWNNIIWSDESRFEVCVGDSRKRVLRKASETYNDDCLVKKVKFPASVMVWGCMSGHGVGKLHFIDGIMNAEKYKKVLIDSFLPYIELCQSPLGQFIFQQDGAACHTAKKIQKWFNEQHIPTLPWVSSSPDLSPIESLWNKMKKALRKQPARTTEELKLKLQQIWDTIQPEECTALVNTMPKRIKAVKANKGGVTQY